MAEPEDHDEIRELQAGLRQALHDYDNTTAEQKAEAFARIVPVADVLVAAQQKQLDRRAEIRAADRRRLLSRILFAAAVVVPVVVLLAGLSLWLLLIMLPLLACGIYLQIAS
ncbi:Flp pilus assembly protein TadB [Kibdelosporangium banguiense]|uniref:Flp pilus assembly protein TadB n=1 Tax=Kibdelosporangium banguiense TaxID=1365924 RepID=A0ABS4TAQ4_9PSEU|nr:hypothetical protein [Kibdelosporangium banguiense]MBP2321505.1 Flp pilus assembly protein TadB [Kibdelosporangium banguiense]